MRQLVDRFLKSDLSRRGFVERMVGLGFTAAAAQSVLAPLEASESAAIGHDMPGVGKVSGTGGETMRRIAGPMVGGLVSATVLTLVVIPVVFALVRGLRLPAGEEARD